MVKVNKSIDFPLITILTALLFISAYCFKLGEALYFGYPSSLISLDLTSVVNVSLKLLFYFVGIVIGFIHFIDNDGKVRVDKAKYVLWTFIAIAIISILLNIKRGDKDLVNYLNSGFFGIFSWLMVMSLVKTFERKDDLSNVNVLHAILTVFFMSATSYLGGVNYHNQFASHLWKTSDGKVVVGEYNGHFVLKKCIDGKGVFSFSEVNGSEFVEVVNYVEGKFNPRCHK
ncbi:hypothetical protein ACNI4F_08535 [Enterobacter hormaechei]|uniref:hypothetical protein n=1 Tax=Enterobacter hormaechei TaxID=158836 RepID=UPI003B9B9B27|nr:hypothetical protein [Enterobacter hormaechei]MCE1620911.1 hypothetical protein [Enterobacter hormaechei]